MPLWTISCIMPRMSAPRKTMHHTPITMAVRMTAVRRGLRQMLRQAKFTNMAHPPLPASSLQAAYT
jgi:D-alanyl-D-alanine dipeptidase